VSDGDRAREIARRKLIFRVIKAAESRDSLQVRKGNVGAIIALALRDARAEALGAVADEWDAVGEVDDWEINDLRARAAQIRGAPPATR